MRAQNFIVMNTETVFNNFHVCSVWARTKVNMKDLFSCFTKIENHHTEFLFFERLSPSNLGKEH